MGWRFFLAVEIRTNVTSDNLRSVDRISGVLRFFAYRRSVQTGRFDILQESAPAVLGVAPSDLPETVRQFFELLHSDDRKPLESALGNLESDARYVFDYRVRTAGATRWLRDSGSATIDASGEPCQEGVIFDITDWPFTRLAIGQASGSVSGFESAIPDIWFVIDANGLFLEYKPSPQIAPLIPPDQFIGRYLEDALPPKIAAQARAKIGLALSSREVQTFEYSLSTDNQEWYEARIAPLAFERVLCVVRDVTRRVQAQEEAEARTAMLTGLAGCAKILLGEPSSDSLGEYISELGRTLKASRVYLVRQGQGSDEPSALSAWQAIPDNLPGAELLDWRQFGGRDADDDLRKGRVVVRSTPPAGIAPILVKQRWWGSIAVQWPSELGWLRADLQGVLELSASHLGTYLEREEVLAEHLGLFNAVNDSENAIIITDGSPAAQILHANDAFRNLTYTSTHAPTTLEEAIHGPVSSLVASLESEPPSGGGQPVFIKDLARWFQVTRSRIGEAAPEASRYVWVLTDITERKQAERTFFDGLLKEQELNERQTRLINNISHQFFTPLSIILSSAELMQHLGEKCTLEKRAQLLARITQSVEQMTGMMHSHLKLEHRPLGEREVFGDGVDLARTLIHVIDDLALEDKRWNAVVPRILGRGRLVRTSERLVRQLMVELLRNAGAYGGEFAGFQIDLDLDQEPVYFSVRDHGLGLPPAGSRPASHRLSTSHGAGLGLAIVRECCQQLCGTFEIGNHAEGGTLAVVKLPDSDQYKGTKLA